MRGRSPVAQMIWYAIAFDVRGRMRNPKGDAQWICGGLSKHAVYLPLLIPIVLFLSSLYIPPRIFIDSQIGFLAFRSMLEGGQFNTITAVSPYNIADDDGIFLTWYSPGQYLVPGVFVWLGTNYGLALSLTALVATIVGLVGWIQIARGFAVSRFVLFVFVLGLSTFAYVSAQFRTYHGGELLLFATAPWCLHGMRWAVSKGPIPSLAVSSASAGLLFFAKLTGLIVFAANVLALTLLVLFSQRRVNTSIIIMWVVSVIAAMCFISLWIDRGPVPSSGSTFSFSWFPIWFSITGAAISGLSGLEFLVWILVHPWVKVSSDYSVVVPLSYILGPLGLLLMTWVWLRLRQTPYRDMTALLSAIMIFYATILAAIYLRGALWDAFEERYYRYPGILFFLLLLTALDESRLRLAKTVACALVVVLGLYGLKSYITVAHAQRAYYDPITGISQDIPPGVLQALRSEISRQDIKRPIAIFSSPAAFLAFPEARILHPFGGWTGYHEGTKWAGQTERIFVVLPENNRRAETILRVLSSYDITGWEATKLSGMVIYSQ
jgi:hypothetical protein